MPESSPATPDHPATATAAEVPDTAGPAEPPAEAEAEEEAEAPTNRAARRRKGRAQDPGSAHQPELSRRARAAQGRRFNPIRRTG